ncbi:uncharacterized protein V3H82_002386 isoform 2-T2 [Fundulus diaphanus]
MGPCCVRLLAEVPQPLQHARSHRGRRVPGGDRRPPAPLQTPADEDQPAASLGGALLPFRHVSLRVHRGGLHRGPGQQKPDHLHLEPESHHAHVRGGAMRFPRFSGAASGHASKTGGVDILKHFWLLQTHPGEAPQRLLRDPVKPASEKAKEVARTLASAAAAPQAPPRQYL